MTAIAIIRISGQVNLSKKVEETLNRLRVRRKYSCVVVQDNKVNIGMIKQVRNFVAFGSINKETFERLVQTRGKSINKDKKIDHKKVSEEFFKGRKLEELNLKPFFRLHPPRKGIDSKKHFGVGKGVLGNNKEEINKLIERML